MNLMYGTDRDDQEIFIVIILHKKDEKFVDIRWSLHKEFVELFIEDRMKLGLYKYKATKTLIGNLHPMTKKLLTYKNEIEEYAQDIYASNEDIMKFDDHLCHLISSAREKFNEMNKMLDYVKFDNDEREEIIKDIKSISDFLEIYIEDEDYGYSEESIDFKKLFITLFNRGIVL